MRVGSGHGSDTVGEVRVAFFSAVRQSRGVPTVVRGAVERAASSAINSAAISAQCQKVTHEVVGDISCKLVHPFDVVAEAVGVVA